EEAGRADVRGDLQVLPRSRDGLRRAAGILERKEARRGHARCRESGLTEQPGAACDPVGLELPDGHADGGDAVLREEGYVAIEGPPEGGDLAHGDPLVHWRHETNLVGGLPVAYLRRGGCRIESQARP